LFVEWLYNLDREIASSTPRRGTAAYQPQASFNTPITQIADTTHQ